MISMCSIATEWTKEWTANDGGLTWAAADVIHVGRSLDRLLESVKRGEANPIQAMDDLYDNLCGSMTGTEADLIQEAMERLASFELYREAIRVENLARLRKEAHERRWNRVAS